jgi:hypothetical protein
VKQLGIWYNLLAERDWISIAPRPGGPPLEVKIFTSDVAVIPLGANEEEWGHVG